MAMEITQALLAAQSPDGQTRTVAEANLKQFQEQNLPQFLLSLSIELSNDQKPPESRRLAGIILKNSLDAKDSARKEHLTQQWVSVDPSIKFQIKESLLRTLGSSVAEARHTSSQVIAKVASIEIPRKEWQDLIGKLLGNVTQAFAPGSLKQATLETLGYVCEEVAPQDLEQDQVNAVLTAVVQGMTSAEPNSDVHLAAIRALYNALDFAQTNFENQVERNFIMKVVCETAVSKESAEIRQAAFECLVAIASIYYDYLEPYMQTLFNLTAEAVRGDEEPVALQAIEFWSTLAEEEMERQDDCVALDELNSPLLHFHFVDKALESLVPMLLETLLKQEEDQDQDDTMWNLSMAGGTCLGLVSKTVGDKVVPLVMPFVERNITKADWRSREAATFAFGSILEGPSVEKLSPLARSGFEFLLSAMKDQSSHVRDTTAWTLGRVFELVHRPVSGDPVINEKNLPGIMTVLLDSIRDVPNVAEKVCGSLYFLAQGYEDAGPASKALTPYYESMIAALLSTADRAGISNVRLRASAYETLNEVVRCSYIPDTLNTTAQLLQEITRRVKHTVDLQVVSSDDREKQSDLQALLCGDLQVIIQKLGGSEGKSVILQMADEMMMAFLQVFGCRSATVHEEAMLAIGALAYVTGADFAKYMPEFYKFLEMGLTNFEEYQVCSISVGVVGDICRALDDKILPYCDGIMTVLLKDLSNAMLNRSVKPQIFSSFGDIALAIGEKFDKYFSYAAPMMQSASEMCLHLDTTDDDMVEYVNQLRRGIFEAYSGMLQGFKNSKPEIMLPYAASLVLFIEAVFKDHSSDDLVTKAAVAALGDLADALGGRIKELLTGSPFYNELLSECLMSDDDVLKETAGWAQALIQHILQS